MDSNKVEGGSDHRAHVVDTHAIEEVPAYEQGPVSKGDVRTDEKSLGPSPTNSFEEDVEVETAPSRTRSLYIKYKVYLHVLIGMVMTGYVRHAIVEVLY